MVQDRTARFTKAWLADRRILCYRFEDTAPLTINAWADDLIHELELWPADKPWRLLLDIRLNGAIVSAYGLGRARDIARIRPELRGRLAILIGSRLASQIISIALRGVPNRYRQRDCFVNEAMAVAWLLEADKPLIG